MLYIVYWLYFLATFRSPLAGVLRSNSGPNITSLSEVAIDPATLVIGRGRRHRAMSCCHGTNRFARDINLNQNGRVVVCRMDSSDESMNVTVCGFVGSGRHTLAAALLGALPLDRDSTIAYGHVNNLPVKLTILEVGVIGRDPMAEVEPAVRSTDALIYVVSDISSESERQVLHKLIMMMYRLDDTAPVFMVAVNKIDKRDIPRKLYEFFREAYPVSARLMFINRCQHYGSKVPRDKIHLLEKIFAHIGIDRPVDPNGVLAGGFGAAASGDWRDLVGDLVNKLSKRLAKVNPWAYLRHNILLNSSGDYIREKYRLTNYIVNRGLDTNTADDTQFLRLFEVYLGEPDADVFFLVGMFSNTTRRLKDTLLSLINKWAWCTCCDCHNDCHSDYHSDRHREFEYLKVFVKSIAADRHELVEILGSEVMWPEDTPKYNPSINRRLSLEQLRCAMGGQDELTSTLLAISMMTGSQLRCASFSGLIPWDTLRDQYPHIHAVLDDAVCGRMEFVTLGRLVFTGKRE